MGLIIFKLIAALGLVCGACGLHQVHAVPITGLITVIMRSSSAVGETFAICKRSLAGGLSI